MAGERPDLDPACIDIESVSVFSIGNWKMTRTIQQRRGYEDLE
jgi:hypothetical protein